MAIFTYDWFRWIITIVLTLFHAIVTYFIFVMRHRKNKTYTSPFFLLYLFMAFADIGTIINNFFVSKFIFIDSWKPWFYDHPMYNTILWLFSGYLIYFQSILHAAMAINRGWVSYTVMTKNTAIGKFGRKLIWFLPLTPLIILSVRFTGHTIYFYTPTGDLAAYYVEPLVKTYHAVAGPTVVFSISMTAFIFTILTIFRYRYLLNKHGQLSISLKHDYFLFGQAIVTLCFQLSIVAYYIMLLIASSQNLLELTTFALRYFNYVNDASSLCNPFALLIVCKFIRKDFIDFLFSFIKNNVTPFNSSGI